MIHSITFKEPNKITIPEGFYVNHAFSLEAIKGRTFEFRPGLNVIVGRNGCGKTSLLNVIRHLTFCDQLFGSSISYGRECWELHTRGNYEKGFWNLADLKAQYSRSIFNLRKSHDMEKADFANSTENFLQSMGSMRRSEGQSVLDALTIMIRYFKYGDQWKDYKEGEKLPKKDKLGLLPHQNFDTMALAQIRKSLKVSNDLWKGMWEEMLSYYEKNNDETFKGPTFLMDEPDKGMDIYNLEQVLEVLTVSSDHIQDIVVLHNIGLIHQLMKLGDKVNFIEMTEGYLDEVEGFFNGRE